MTVNQILTFTAATLLFALPAAAGDPSGNEFTGTAVVDTTQGTRSMPLSLVVNRYSTLDELYQLGDVLATAGQSGLLGALRFRNDGQLRLGAVVSPIALVAAEETSRGYRIFFLTARRIDVDEKQLGKDSLEYPFGVAVLEIDNFSGRGEGALHVAAALEIDSIGHLEVIDYDGQNGHFRDLRRVR